MTEPRSWHCPVSKVNPYFNPYLSNGRISRSGCLKRYALSNNLVCSPKDRIAKIHHLETDLSRLISFADIRRFGLPSMHSLPATSYAIATFLMETSTPTGSSLALAALYHSRMLSIGNETEVRA